VAAYLADHAPQALSRDLVLHHAMKQIIRSYVLMIRAEIGTLRSEGSERCVQNVAERAAVTSSVAGSPWPDDTHI
jgi:hypothetical protein